MTPPCKHCTDRKVGCHGDCERYRQYKADFDAAKAEIYGDPVKNLIMRDVELKRLNRIAHKKHVERRK